MPESGEERVKFLNQVFAAYGPSPKEIESQVIEGLKSCGIKDQVLLAKIIIHFCKENLIEVAQALGFNDPQALSMLWVENIYADRYGFFSHFPACNEACQMGVIKYLLPKYDRLILSIHK